MKKEYFKNNKLTNSPSFSNQIYQLLLSVPKGQITTYADLAKALNSKAYRAVGSAMAKNPWLICIPCHRVVNANGSLGNYALGSDKKRHLLEMEGIEFSGEKISDFNARRFRFD